MASKAKDIGVRDSFDMKVIVKMITVGGVKHGRIVVESDHFEIEWINSKTFRMTKANKEYHRITTTTSNTTLWEREHRYSRSSGLPPMSDCTNLNKYYDRQIFEAKKKELPWNEQQELELAYKAEHSDDLNTDDSIDGEDAVDKFIGILKERQHNITKK